MSNNKKPIKVIVCRVGRAAVVEELQPNPDLNGGHLCAMQKIVGGLIQCVTLDDGIDLWCNEEGMLLELPLNRCFAAAPRGEPGIPVDFVIYASDDLARPHEPGEWRIQGDFFLCRSNRHGELAPPTDADIAKYTRLFESEDIAAAKRMNDMRAKLVSP